MGGDWTLAGYDGEAERPSGVDPAPPVRVAGDASSWTSAALPADGWRSRVCAVGGGYDGFWSASAETLTVGGTVLSEVRFGDDAANPHVRFDERRLERSHGEE